MARRGRHLSLSARENIDGYIFILPWIIGFLFLNAFPMFYSLYLAFTKWNIVGKVHWAGLVNFKRMFDMSRSLGVEFRKSVLVTFYFTALSIPLKIIWSITLALLLRKAVSFRRLFISIFYLPAVISGVSTALMWKWIFDERKGFINNLLAL